MSSTKADVEFRLVALDEIVFERERFARIVEDDGVEVGDFAGERAGFGVHPAGFEEVGADAAAERRGFADVEDGAGGVFEEIDAGTVGEERGFFAGFHGLQRTRITHGRGRRSGAQLDGESPMKVRQLALGSGVGTPPPFFCSADFIGLKAACRMRHLRKCGIQRGYALLPRGRTGSA